MTKQTYHWTREQGDWSTARRAMQQKGSSVEADYDCSWVDHASAKLVGQSVAIPLGSIESDRGKPAPPLKSLTVTWEATA